jgi:hypothetical protein
MPEEAGHITFKAAFANIRRSTKEMLDLVSADPPGSRFCGDLAAGRGSGRCGHLKRHCGVFGPVCRAIVSVV